MAGLLARLLRLSATSGRSPGRLRARRLGTLPTRMSRPQDRSTPGSAVVASLRRCGVDPRRLVLAPGRARRRLGLLDLPRRPLRGQRGPDGGSATAVPLTRPPQASRDTSGPNVTTSRPAAPTRTPPSPWTTRTSIGPSSCDRPPAIRRFHYGDV